jgi:spore coat protein U-like protein
MHRISKIAAAATVAALAFLLAPRSAQAQTATGSFTVTATVGKACTVAAAPIVIASYDPNASVATVGTTNVNVACTKGTTYTTFLTSAKNWTLTDTATSAGNALTYAISQGASATAWTGTSGWAGSAPSKAPVSYVATAKIAAGQDVPAGTYTDTVTMNVNY